MMRAWLVVVSLFAVGASAARKPCPQPLWTVDLAAKFHFRTFGLVRHPRNQAPALWKTQQGVTFIAPEILAVYQVLENSGLPALEPRDESGGGGKFILQVVFLDTKQGEEVRTLRLITSGLDFSGVYPTYDGRFLLRAGQVLRLYSPTFQEIASRPLPLSRSALHAVWDIHVSPSGRLIYATYEEDNGFNKDYKIERYLLNAGTLDAVPHPRPSDVALWPAADTLFSDFKGSAFGVFTPDGTWQAFDYDPKVTSCPYGFARVTRQVFAAYGCKELKLFLLDGRPFWDVPMRNEVRTLLSSGSLLAVEIDHPRWDPLDLGLLPKPLRIAVYDLATKSEKCSIPIRELASGWWYTMFYAVSPAGTVAVIQGNMLSLYRP